MITIHRSKLLMMFVLSASLLFSCGGNETPDNTPATVETLDATNITEISAVCKGRITNRGSGAITTYGIELDDGKGDPKKYPATSMTNDQFSITISDLASSQKYDFRAYVNDGAIRYGKTKSFTTLKPSTPSEFSATLNTSSIKENSASITFILSPEIKEWGVYYNENDISENNLGKKFTSLSEVATITGLKDSTTYAILPYGMDKSGKVRFLEKQSFTTFEAYNKPVDTMPIRDPFILVDKENRKYYVYENAGNKVRVYRSKNLSYWKDLGMAFTPASNFWGKSDFWAPDVYYYKQKYYLFITLSAPGINRGTSILVADKPVGPFTPLVNKAVTPSNWMSLDGALYIDKNNTPWILYCHEWLESIDGKVIAQQLKEDLTETVGDPQVLFKASEAPWVGSITSQGVRGNVTDAPFIYKTDDGTLIMLWSSFRKDGKYAIGQATSVSGELSGPWIQETQTLNDDNGGHAMLFHNLNGQLMISYHAPNSGNWRPIIKPVTITNNKVRIN